MQLASLVEFGFGARELDEMDVTDICYWFMAVMRLAEKRATR